VMRGPMTLLAATCVIAFSILIAAHVTWVAVALAGLAALSLSNASIGSRRNDPRTPRPSIDTILHRRTRGLRASTAEREVIVAVLGQHMADGRLDLAEYEQRVTAAWAAVIRADLAALVADLPRIDHATPDPYGPYHI
jgi:hypothetical protein